MVPRVIYTFIKRFFINAKCNKGIYPSWRSNNLAFEPNVMKFCSECKFKSVDRGKTDDHIQNTGHKILVIKYWS